MDSRPCPLLISSQEIAASQAIVIKEIKRSYAPSIFVGTKKKMGARVIQKNAVPILKRYQFLPSLRNPDASNNVRAANSTARTYTHSSMD